MVGVAGFEPTTPCPPDKCANRAALHSDGALIGKRRAHDNAFCRKMAIELTPIALEREFARLPANLRAARATRPVRRFPAPVWASGPALGARPPSRRAGEARSAHAAPSVPVAAWRPGRARSPWSESNRGRPALSAVSARP